jgi:branched-chain amino acid transport system substrate-binding protein
MRASQFELWVSFVVCRVLCAIVAQLTLAFFAPMMAPAAAAASLGTVRVAFIDPLSGPFANTGESALRHFRAAVEREAITRTLNGGRPNVAGARIELVPFDNKASAQEALVQLRAAIDQGIRFVLQGQSSAAALALIDAIDKHNARTPGQEVLFLNYAALDPELTNAKCSFWHFRFDAPVDMRMEALVEAIVRDGTAKNLYLIGQDYSFGRSVAQTARAMLARKMPAARIVGDDLHPIGTVKDFAPYIAKIKAAGADTVVTGNWGNDLALLVKAAREQGFSGDFYTFYAGSPGAVTAIGKAGLAKLKQVNEWHPNVQVNGKRVLEPFGTQFKQRYAEDFRYLRFLTLTDMFAAALERAGSAEPQRVAFALEGMRSATPTGEVEMRSLDHQLIQPLYVSTLALTARQGGAADVVIDTENTGLGFKTDARIEGYATAQPTSCTMTRPARAEKGR